MCLVEKQKKGLLTETSTSLHRRQVRMVEKLQPAQLPPEQWTLVKAQGPTTPVPRHSHAAVGVGSRLVMVRHWCIVSKRPDTKQYGGLDEHGNILRDVWVFNIESARYRQALEFKSNFSQVEKAEI